MKTAYFLTVIIVLSACSTLPEHSEIQSLKSFDNLEQVEAFTKQRKAAVEKIESYPGKTQFWGRFKFWKNRGVVEEVIVTGIRAAADEEGIVDEVVVSDDSITNNQEKNVDEGGIVKRLGDYMIVLRRGKLYSLHIGKSLTKVDEISVQQENWQHHAWYDEILADNGQVVVVGYSYDRGASEYLFFDLDAQGKFTRGAVHLVESNDYFSSENYASRLVGGKLIFLIKDIPIIEAYEEEGRESEDNHVSPLSPYTATIDAQGELTQAYPLFEEQQTYAPIMSDIEVYATTIAVCPLSKKPFSCRATPILGGYATETYASRDAYYIWMTGADWDVPFESLTDEELKRYAWNEYFETVEDNRVSAIYRIPYESQNLGAVKIKGQPINQFSFKEKNNQLQLLTRVVKKRGFYFDAKDSAGSTYYASINLNWFEQGVYEYGESDYIKISDDQEGWKLNRFIGDQLLYISNIWREDTKEDIARVNVFSVNDLTVTKNFDTTFSVEQLQKVGNNALLVGYNNNDAVVLSSLSINDDRGIVDSNTLSNLEISEFRSHGFFYKPNSEGGIFAIPLDVEVTEGKTWKKENGIYYHLEPTTNMFYTQLNTDLSMQKLGQLEGSKELVWNSNEDCNVSCTDWYGSSRPIFWGDRIFSLIKYELIEGKLEDGNISEISRFNFK